jgi:hypothetical protein
VVRAAGLLARAWVYVMWRRWQRRRAAPEAGAKVGAVT